MPGRGNCKMSFATWLEENAELGSRGRRDVVSRARRVSQWLDLNTIESGLELEYQLRRNPDFCACTPCVRSQLKRAASLYLQFQGSRATE